MIIPIYIPTKGRWLKQKTYSQLPEDLRQDVRFVVPFHEGPLYQQQFPPERVLYTPEKLEGIAATRDHIMQFAAMWGQRYIVMLDDDLTLQRRLVDPDTGSMPIRNSTKLQIYEAFQWLVDKLNEGYIHCGWSIRFNAFATPGEEMSPGRMMHCLAYNVQEVMRLNAKFSKGVDTWHSMDDFNMTLQLLSAGFPNVVSLVHRMNPAASNSSGGASTWRTLQTQNASAQRMKQLFPDFVRIREKKNWRGMDGEKMIDITADWKQALAFGRAQRVVEPVPPTIHKE